MTGLIIVLLVCCLFTFGNAIETKQPNVADPGVNMPNQGSLSYTFEYVDNLGDSKIVLNVVAESAEPVYTFTLGRNNDAYDVENPNYANVYALMQTPRVLWITMADGEIQNTVLTSSFCSNSVSCSLNGWGRIPFRFSAKLSADDCSVDKFIVSAYSSELLPSSLYETKFTIEMQHDAFENCQGSGSLNEPSNPDYQLGTSLSNMSPISMVFGLWASSTPPQGNIIQAFIDKQVDQHTYATIRNNVNYERLITFTQPSPTNAPTNSPTQKPTTAFPTEKPTTAFPTKKPTTPIPTRSPVTEQPTTLFPTAKPTTAFPTKEPTTARPTTAFPTRRPSTSFPTKAPVTNKPSSEPGVLSCPMTDTYIKCQNVNSMWPFLPSGSTKRNTHLKNKCGSFSGCTSCYSEHSNSPYICRPYIASDGTKMDKSLVCQDFNDPFAQGAPLGCPRMIPCPEPSVLNACREVNRLLGVNQLQKKRLCHAKLSGLNISKGDCLWFRGVCRGLGQSMNFNAAKQLLKKLPLYFEDCPNSTTTN